MRRFLVAALLAFVAVTHASAQSEASVYVRLFPDTAKGPHARVRVMGLLDDPTWRAAVTNSYPVRLEWTVQLWKENGLFSAQGPKAEWKETIQRNSVLNIYELTTEVPGQRIAPQQFATLDLLALQLGRPTELDEFGPRSPGNWYYRVTLKLSTLTDDEINKLGTPDPSAVQKVINKFLFGFSQPSRTLTADSKPAFRWP